MNEPIAFFYHALDLAEVTHPALPEQAQRHPEKHEDPAHLATCYTPYEGGLCLTGPFPRTPYVTRASVCLPAGQRHRAGVNPSLLLSFVQPNPPPRLDQRGLDRRVGVP